MAQLVEKGDGKWGLKGELTFETVPALLPSVKNLMQGSAVIVDLEDVTRADSAGLAMLLEWVFLAKKKQIEVTLTDLSVQLLAMARVSGLDEILPIQSH
ncbi:MAG: STAS domain-containing protein [Methylococcales bacterium]|jgi:phospholipid transport system transporter-binding protein|nr:STAS domain-containing protein [Methylococcales bacterium]MBT7445595.1 STAS domain-containing protein [Methylococcales bacterium]